MAASVRAIDAVLKSDTPSGPVWHRYDGDGYGEHRDGAAFDGAGIGRGWPLLSGERGHVALLGGEDARPYLEAMTRMTGPGGLCRSSLGQPCAPERGLYPGRLNGSAMPLVWAHAEFIACAQHRIRRAGRSACPNVARYGRRPRLEYVSRRASGRARWLPARITGTAARTRAVHWGQRLELLADAAWTTDFRPSPAADVDSRRRRVR
jgi:glucoamylase